MSISRERIDAILDDVENKAYRRGWQDAMKDIEAAALQRLTNRQTAQEEEKKE